MVSYRRIVSKINDVVERWHLHSLLEKRYRKILQLNGIHNKEVFGEAVWLKKWSQYGVKVTPTQYRVFSQYIGPEIDIVPEEVCHCVIEPILNSKATSDFYSDKNFFDKIVGAQMLPKTILRRINGFFYDDKYRRIQLSDPFMEQMLSSVSVQKVILKPSVDGISGRGVVLFTRNKKDGHFYSEDRGLLNQDFLISCSKNIIIQECVEQHSFMAQFCETSVNTLRLALYKSVIDDEPHVLGAVIRIGKKGSCVDNAHSGGRFIGINEEGLLLHKVYNQYGIGESRFNGIDFCNNTFQLPFWKDVVDFAKNVSLKIIHHRLIALDISVDKDSHPVLIEYNCAPETFSTWLFQYTKGPAFGKYTDEILSYVKKQIEG